MASDKVTHVGDADFKTSVLEHNLPVLVDFWAPWCGPCRAIAPMVDQLADELHGKLKVVKVNTDEAVDVAAQFGIRSIPTLLVFKGGKVSGQIVGAVPLAKLRVMLDKAMA